MSTPDPTPTPLPAAPDWRALCQELRDALDNVFQVMAGEAGTNHISTAINVLLRADVALATPPPLDDDERLRLVTAGVCSGYIAGHEATVEGHYGDPEEVAADMAPVVLAEVGATPPAATREAGPLPQAGAGISDEELLELMPQQLRNDFAEAARCCAENVEHVMAAGGFRVLLNTSALAYARTVWDRAVLARWGGAAVLPKTTPTEEDIEDLADVFSGDAVLAIRRALELWGGAAVPVPAAAAGDC